jgi:hypothetical protein
MGYALGRAQQRKACLVGSILTVTGVKVSARYATRFGGPEKAIQNAAAAASAPLSELSTMFSTSQFICGCTGRARTSRAL